MEKYTWENNTLAEYTGNQSLKALVIAFKNISCPLVNVRYVSVNQETPTDWNLKVLLTDQRTNQHSHLTKVGAKDAYTSKDWSKTPHFHKGVDPAAASWTY